MVVTAPLLRAIPDGSPEFPPRSATSAALLQHVSHRVVEAAHRRKMLGDRAASDALVVAAREGGGTASGA